MNLNIKKSSVGILLGFSLIACGGFVYTTVGGNVNGLTKDGQSKIVLADQANFRFTLGADGPFSFKVASNGSYNIRVLSQPDPVNCTVVNGVGKMTSETPLTNIVVNCVPNVPVSGFINGLLVNSTIGLNRTGGTSTDFNRTQTEPPVPSDNSFFLYVLNGQAYDVKVTSQPPAQVCSVVNGKGIADITNLASAKNVAVNCVPGVPVRATLNGLKSGLFITLTNNADDNNLLTLFANTPAPTVTTNGNNVTTTTSHASSFNKSLLNGAPYAVTVKTQPVGQNCIVVNETGIAILGSPIVPIDVTVNCT